MQRPTVSGNLDRVWSKDVGDGSSRKGRVVASPVISGGRIFVMDGENRVAAFDANTGDEVWRHKVTVQSKERTREGRDSLFERISNPLSITKGGGGEYYGCRWKNIPDIRSWCH